MTLTDARQMAAAARSILSCPVEVDLVVDGLDHPLRDDSQLGLLDAGGLPTFLCTPGGALSGAARAGRNVVLTISSGLEEASWETLTLAGTLRAVGMESCTCCVETRERVIVDVSLVQLAGEDERRCRVPLAEFRSPAHALNEGYLRRAADHANESHQEELRRAVARLRRMSEDLIIGVSLQRLTPHGAHLTWVDLDGAHSCDLPFPVAAATAESLGLMLRTHLDPGIC
jgi:hypothetical protein